MSSGANGVARSLDPPLRHHRDRQRQLALQKPRRRSSPRPRSRRLRNPSQLRRRERYRQNPPLKGVPFACRSGGPVQCRLTVYGAPTRTAANRAAAEKRTVPFSWSRPIILRNQRLTGFGVVYRWTAHSPQKTSVQIQPPFARFHTDLAALFKLPHISQRLWLAVYNYVREGTEDIVLCCGRIA